MFKMKILLLIMSAVFTKGYLVMDNSSALEVNEVNHRHPKYFPFYTLGRFENVICTGTNSLIGTCVLKGQCNDLGGTQTGFGACSGAISNQAQCCVLTRTCGSSTNVNNTYFTNAGYPQTFAGGSVCNIAVTRSGTDVCQLRVDFLDMELAQPTGDGACTNDYFTITGGSRIPRICGRNTGQHVYVNFNGNNPVTVTVATSSAFTFNRRWHLHLQMIGCDSTARAPSGCLQYWMDATNTISVFNYETTGSGVTNAIGVQGSRQIASLAYGACVFPQPGTCSITWTLPSTDIYAFTLTGDVGAVDPTILGTSAVQQTTGCATDFVTIPNAFQNNIIVAGGDRFCGLGLAATTSNIRPFVIYSVTDANETPDIGNRGWSLTYTQNQCPL